MTSKLIVHFYLPDESRTACKLPIRGANLISRLYNQTECQACIETDSWKEAAAAAMERALTKPLLINPHELIQRDWLEYFEEPKNAFFSKYLLKKVETFKATLPSNAFIPIDLDACEGLAPNEFHAQLFGKYKVPYVRLELPPERPSQMRGERCARCSHTLEEHEALGWVCDCPACPWKTKKVSDYMTGPDGQQKRIATPEEHGVLDYDSLKKAHKP